jgi:hypothetical protein
VARSDAFIARITPNGESIRWCTLMGGSSNDVFNGVATHPCGAIYAGGNSNSADLPVLDAAQGALGLINDLMFVCFGVDGELVYSTYLGGDANDYGGALVIDDDGAMSFVGYSSATDLATTAQAYQPELADNRDLAVGSLTGNAPADWTELFVDDGLPDATRGFAYDATLGTSGGSGPFDWAVFDGAPPAGLTMSALGAVTGTPTQDGAVTFGVDVTGTCGVDGAEITIEVNPPASFSGNLLPEWTAGVPISALIVPAGGTAPFTFDPPVSALPPGTSFSTEGRLTGTPSRIGRFTFDVRVTDRWGATATHTAVLDVNTSVTMSTTALPECTEGADYTVVPEASGGTGALTWEVRGGAVHTGALDPATGAFQGAVRSPGDYFFTLRVRDTVGGFVDRAFSVHVNQPPEVVTETLPPAAVGRPYTASVANRFGTPPYTWNVTGDGLPLGVTLDASTGEFSGTPTTPDVRESVFRCTDDCGIFGERLVPMTVAPAADLAAKGRHVENVEYVAAGDVAPTLRFVDLLEGSDLTVTVKRLGKAKGPAPYELELLDASGTPIDVRAFTKTSKKAVAIKKFSVPRTDRYFVRLTPDRESIGKLKLDVRATAPKSLSGSATLDPDGDLVVLPFPALLGAKLTVDVKPAKKSAALPLLDAVTDASGADLLTGGKRKQKKGGDALKGALVTEGGDGSVRIVAAEGSGVGEIAWRISLKVKKGYALELLR